MNEEAANCLLKTLEEPPQHTILVLLAPDESSVLPTISSRCIHVALRPMPRNKVEAALLERGAEPEQAHKLAALSGGRLGWAIGALSTPTSVENRGAVLQEMSVLVGGTAVERIEAATRLAKHFTDNRGELFAMLDTWEGWWRDVLVVSAAAGELAGNVDQLPAITSLAKRETPGRAHEMVRLIQTTRRQLLENVNPRLALEALTLGLP
jgi:DNA polymerase-3 subunit delta'